MKTSDSLEMELLIIVSHPVGAGYQTKVLWKSTLSSSLCARLNKICLCVLEKQKGRTGGWRNR